MAKTEVRHRISEGVQQALGDAGLSVARAAAAMSGPDGKQVEPKLIYRWLNGEVTAPLDQLHRLAMAIGQPITIHLGPQKKEAAPPDWVERLLTGVIALEDDAEITDDALDRARAKAIAALTLGANPGRPRQGGAGGGTGTTS